MLFRDTLLRIEHLLQLLHLMLSELLRYCSCCFDMKLEFMWRPTLARYIPSRVMFGLDFGCYNKTYSTTTIASTQPRRPAPMPIARCSLRCGSSNAFRPQQALRSLFCEQQLPLNLSNARGISLSHRNLQDGRPVVEIPPADAKTPTKLSPIPPPEYVNTASLQGSLQTLRRKNRERLLDQEHASSDEPPPSGEQSNDDKVNEILDERKNSINKATLPTSTEEPEPSRPTISKAQKITNSKRKHTSADILEYKGMYVRPSMGAADPEQEYPWTNDIPDELRGTAR